MAYVTESFDDEIVRLLHVGGVGLLPTDTIYGLSCRALDRGAVERLHRLKGRSAHKPFIILISDIKMLNILSISKEQVHIIKGYWPGPLSVVFKSDAADFLTRGTNSLAVRMPNYPALLNVINKVGPIISTSANLQGEQPIKSAKETIDLFGDSLDFYVDCGELDNLPSTLAIINDGQLEVVRQGAVKIR